MKHYFVLLPLILLIQTSCAQNNKLDQIIEAHKEDTALVKQLNDFAQKGYGKELDTKGITAQDLIDTALSYLGTPHCMGGTTHSCIDCSGLLYRTFQSLGIDLPHNSQDMARYGTILTAEDSLQAGDLVFFIRTYNTDLLITHSGIYIGNGKFIHTSSQKGVIISDLGSPYYKEHFIFATRVLQ